MDSPRWCLLLSRCLVLYSKWGPLAQSLLAPNSRSYTSSSLKCSPNKHNKHMFSHLEPAYLESLWIYTWSLLSIDKTNPAATKDSALLLPFGALWPRDASLCCWVKSPWYASPLCGPPFSTGRFLVLFSSGWENCVTDCGRSLDGTPPPHRALLRHDPLNPWPIKYSHGSASFSIKLQILELPAAEGRVIVVNYRDGWNECNWLTLSPVILMLDL